MTGVGVLCCQRPRLGTLAPKGAFCSFRRVWYRSVHKGEGMSKLSLLIVVLFSIAACATAEKYEAILNSWVGVHSDQLVTSWRVPQSSFRLSNGNTVLQYERERTVQSGGTTYKVPKTTETRSTIYGTRGASSVTSTTTTYETRQTPIRNETLRCVTRFIVGLDSRILKWAYEGDDCVAQ